MEPDVRRPALGDVIGAAALIGSRVVAGAPTDGHSPVDGAISDPTGTVRRGA